MKKLLIILTAFTFIYNLHGQIGGGAKLGYDVFLAGYGIKTISVGGFGTFELENEILLRGGLQLGLPYKYTSDYTATAYDSDLEPESMSVSGEYKFKTLHVTADGIKYFGKGDADNGGFYGVLGVGLTIASEQVVYDYGSIDTNAYSVTQRTDEGKKERAAQPMIRGFVGYDVEIDDLHPFVELGLSLAANKVNEQSVGITLPPYFQIAAGVRF
jgi:hypothetical protein